MSSNNGDWGSNPTYAKNQLEFYSNDKNNYYKVDIIGLTYTVSIQNNNIVHMYVNRSSFHKCGTRYANVVLSSFIYNKFEFMLVRKKICTINLYISSSSSF